MVYCEVESVDAPRALHYTRRGEEDGAATDVRYLLEPIPGGTRFTWSQTGFRGPGGFAMSRLLGTVHRRMLTDGVPPVLVAITPPGRPERLG